MMNDMLNQQNQEMKHLITSSHESLVEVSSGRQGQGAGVIWRSDGLIITNAHVVRRRTPQVTLWDGSRYAATLVAKDEQNDLAALKIDATDLPMIKRGSSEAVLPGQWVTAAGHPWGVLGAASAGSLIASGPPLEWGENGRSMLQESLQLRPGHSGGPLLDENGRLIGINTMISGPQVGLAIPVHVVEQFVARLENDREYI